MKRVNQDRAKSQDADGQTEDSEVIEGMQMEEIHPRMTEVDKQRALDEIMRVLRGEE